MKICRTVLTCLVSSVLQELEKVKPVILTGDLNCAHQEIDIYNPAVSDLHGSLLFSAFKPRLSFD